MKRRIAFTFLLLVLVSCLSPQAVLAEQTLYEFQKDSHVHNAFHDGVFDVEQGYYIFLPPFMYYVEKESMDGIIACGKMECNHIAQGCNAFLPNFGMHATLYGDTICYSADTQTGIHLYQMDLSLSNREKIATIGGYANNPLGNFILHRQNLFYMLDNALYQLPLKNMNDTPKEVGLVSDKQVNSEKFWADGDKVYVWIRDAHTYIPAIYVYDMTNASFEHYWTMPGTEVVGKWATDWFGINGWYIENDKMTMYLSGNGIWQYDGLSKTYLPIAEITDPMQKGGALFTQRYIIIHNGNTVEDASQSTFYIYNAQGEFIASIPYGNLFTYKDENNVDLSDGVMIDILGVDDNVLLIEKINPIDVTYQYKDGMITVQESELYYADMAKPSEGIKRVPLYGFGDDY